MLGGIFFIVYFVSAFLQSHQPLLIAEEYPIAVDNGGRRHDIGYNG